MLEELTETLRSSRTETLAKAFLRWGRSGFWALVVMGALPLIIMIYTLVFEVGTLLFYFLSAPQAGIPTLQTTAGAAVATWVSAVDMMNLMSVILTLGGEIFALIFGLLLLFRTIQVPAEPANGSH